MAAPAHKRQKVAHDASGDEDDQASFDSFGDSQEDERDLVSEDEFMMDEDESAGNEISNPSDTARTKGLVTREQPSNTPQHRKTVGRKNGPVTTTGRNAFVAGNHKSTMFKLQLDELLEQIRPRHGKREIQAEEALRRLKSAIESIPEKKPLSVDEAERQLLGSSKTRIPFPDPRPPKDAKYKFEYAKPVNINVIGSHVLKTFSRGKKVLEIDMVVTMPPTLFQEKDYLNFRYFYKRAYYLASIADGLKAALGQEFRVKFDDFRGDLMKPTAVVTPLAQIENISTASSPPKWQINIIPCITEDTFRPEKLALNRSCIRNHPQRNIAGLAENDEPVATLFYNSSLRSDMLTASYLKLIHAGSKICDSFRDACLLGNTWLRQRGLGSHPHDGGFGNFEWSALLALFLQGGSPGGKHILSEGYSSYQLFKATIQLLAMRDFCKQPLVVSVEGEALKFSSSKTPIIWDAKRQHNLLYEMAPWSYNVLRQEARTTLNALGDQNFDGFDATFILRTDGLLYRYDCVAELTISRATAHGPKATYTLADQYRQLYEILHRGLGDRTPCINIIPHQSEPWGTESMRPGGIEETPVTIGITTNAEKAGRLIDHGPAAEEKSQAAAFRKFWGDKAELRRFKDGSIQETLVWSGKENGPSVIEQICHHLIQKHFGHDVEQTMSVSGNGFRKFLSHDGMQSSFQNAMDAFKQLETDLRSLEGLPLVVRQIMPADAQLRYASIKAPLARRNEPPGDVVLQFEGSSRWPDDLVAIQRTKIAFLLKLREQLLESIDSITARLGLENGEHDVLNQGSLDIIYDSGTAFRLRIHHDREQTLLERNLKDKTIDQGSKEIAAMGLAAYKRDYIRAPAHTQAIARLCSRHPALSGTIRLLKKWFASHLLANHIAEEVIELMAARTFVQPWPWELPASIQTGFLRTLSWISRWDWKVEPLIVDLSGSEGLKPADIQSVQTKFEAWRKLDPALNRVVLFAASSVDSDGTTWTDGRPAKVVAGRMTALARSACAEISEKQLGLNPGSLFESSLNDFDIVIRLEPIAFGQKKSRKRSGTNGTVFKNLELDLVGDTTSVGLDCPGSLLRELEALYGSAILFFSGGRERPVIAGLWHPQTDRRIWKLNLSYSTVPLKDKTNAEVQTQANKEAIVAEIARLGGDLIQSIQLA